MTEKSRIDISCHYLARWALGNLRACCFPWKYKLNPMLILRSRSLKPRIRYKLGRPRSYLRYLIEQKFEWPVAAQGMRSAELL